MLYCRQVGAGVAPKCGTRVNVELGWPQSVVLSSILSSVGSKVLYSGGTYFGGCKVHLQIGPYLAAIKRSLLLEISGRMSLLASTRQRSNGSDGDSGPDGQAVSQPMHGRCGHRLAIGRCSQFLFLQIFYAHTISHCRRVPLCGRTGSSREHVQLNGVASRELVHEHAEPHVAAKTRPTQWFLSIIIAIFCSDLVAKNRTVARRSSGPSGRIAGE